MVVLTCARSGSTLLRFILDSHPGLACPPETGIVELCTRLGVVAMLLDGPPTDAPPGLSNLAAATIRSWVSVNYSAYLAKVGKKRWCDKSLGSAESANRFLDLFPKAKFICLYRNCLDVIDSTLEASPFGLRGYGLDPFAAAHPGNNVAAVADYWAWHTRMITEFQDAHQDVCLGVRYEDLVSDPEGQADRIFAFLGEAPVPGISRACLPSGQEQFGAGDHKIWSTFEITPDSVGRGTRIPPRAISAPVLAMVNSLLERLDYQILDPDARVPRVTAGPYRPGPAGGGGAVTGQTPGAADDVAGLDELEDILTDRLAATGPALAAGQGPGAAQAASFVICATTEQGPGEPPLGRWWRVDAPSGSVSRGGEHAPAFGSGQWGVIGDACTWRSVLAGELNLATALRQSWLRYTGTPVQAQNVPSALRSDPRSGILTRLLATPPAATCAARPAQHGIGN